jgi:hypothetical protein
VVTHPDMADDHIDELGLLLGRPIRPQPTEVVELSGGPAKLLLRRSAGRRHQSLALVTELARLARKLSDLYQPVPMLELEPLDLPVDPVDVGGPRRRRRRADMVSVARRRRTIP